MAPLNAINLLDSFNKGLEIMLRCVHAITAPSFLTYE